MAEAYVERDFREDIHLSERDRSHENLLIIPVKTAFVGMGGISMDYGKFLVNSPEVNVVSCSDHFPDVARSKALQLGIEKAATFDEILSDPTIEMVVNLTNPLSHASVTRAALEAGKHVFSEKPLAGTFVEGRELVELAAERNLSYACAPDTFLGSHFQSAQEYIASGKIGDAFHISGTLKDMGPSGWHPSPESFYSEGGGPVYDWGPYYLTHAVGLFGSVESVIADGSIVRPERRVETGPRSGEIYPVTVPTHVSSILRFESGVKMDLVLSFETTGARKQSMEVYGSEGTLQLVSPNLYDGKLLFGKTDGEEFQELPLLFDDVGPGVRGYGVTEFARAIRTGEVSRLDARLGLHVLEVMEGIHKAVRTDTRQFMTTSIVRPEPMQAFFPAFTTYQQEPALIYSN